MTKSADMATLLDSNSKVPGADVATGSLAVSAITATGTPSSSTFLRGDGSWQTAGQGVNVQTFTSSGTWTKPAYSASSRVLIQCWGGGGGGGKNTGGAGGAGGGGGGAYNERWVTLSQMGATETATVGAGGNAVSTNTHGNAGGNTSLGSLITAYGGGGGPGNWGGTGGGQLSSGGFGGASNGVSNLPGLPRIMALSDSAGYAVYQGSNNNTTSYGANIADAFWHGGGGGDPSSTSQGPGARSVWGGGGGGGGNGTNAAGVSIFGGNGGAGSSASSGGNGTQPSGGGGGTNTGATSGAGAAGQIIVTVFPA